MVTEEALQATGLPEKTLATYRLAHAHDPSLSRADLAIRLGVKPDTVKRRLSQVRQKLKDPDSLEFLGRSGKTGQPQIHEKHPEKFAAAVVELSGTQINVAEVARSVGIAPNMASKIAKLLDGELLPLKRELTDVRLDDLTKRFGTLARDAVDAITPQKLASASAQQLAIVAGVATDKFQLLRGQPTQRMEIGDRRKLDEVLNLILKEAKRRNIEIDVTPEGGVTAKKSPFRNAKHRDMMKQLTSGDPVETLTPA
jgi:transposase-like protein